MPQYLMSVWHDTDYDVDFTSPDRQRQVARVSAVNAELEAAGAWVFGGGLHAASSATVACDGPAIDALDGPGAGLLALELIDADAVATYQPFHAARADLLARCGRTSEADSAYQRAIDLSDNPVERRFLHDQRTRGVS